MKGIGWRLLEPEALVPAARTLVLGVDEHDANPELVGRVIGTQHRILKQRPPEPLPLVRGVNRQSSQENGGNRPPARLTFEHSPARLLGTQLRRSEGVVADDALAVAADEDARRAGTLGAERMVGQPPVKLGLPTVESLALVPALERLGTGTGHRARTLLEGAWPRKQLSESGGDPGRPVEDLREAIPALIVEREHGAVCQNPLGLENRRAANELAQLAVGLIGGLANDNVVVGGYPEIPAGVPRAGTHRSDCTDRVRTMPLTTGEALASLDPD